MTDMLLSSQSRFTPLLISLLVYIFGVLPFVVPGRARSLIIEGVLSALLVSGVFAVSKTRRTLIRSSAVVVVLVSGSWWLTFHDTNALRIVLVATMGIAVFGGTVLVLRQVLTAPRVTAQTIQGAICGYLMLILCWSFLYTLAEIGRPGSFQGLEFESSVEASSFLYFSFVTMTTLGFGDISPLSESARSLVTLQALVGQFYMAILVARLVALHTREQR